ncbi:MAG: hypothetical protein JSU77_11445 [Fidelibacterota bacterium]|nr:MAG: hypothetical protein JSU77_11445 [Candidatus Neomarinimicrobiota bacterium]
MKAFGNLLVREFKEWRTVLLVLGILYLLGLIGATIGMGKLSSEMESRDEIRIGWGDEEWDISDFSEYENKWLSSGEVKNAVKSSLLLFGWSYMLRITVSMLNLVLMVISVFYLVDAIFKERSDGSTFFYRGLPVGDLSILFSKLLVGTVGFLAVSYVLGVVWVLFARLTFPGDLSGMMTELGYSLSQLRVFDFFGDWIVFHFLLMLWLLPFATYFLFVSTVTRSRPLLVGVGAPLLLGLLWLWIFRDDGLLALFTSNISAVANVLDAEWIMSEGPPRIFPGERLEMFGSFGSHMLSLRTAISLLVAGGFFCLTFFAYRRNMPVS